MGRRKRVFDNPERVYMVGNRTHLERLTLTPSPAINLIILGCFARAVQGHHIEVINFIFMGNHFHIILRARRLNMASFMKVFQASLTRELNLHLGRRGPLFTKRYHCDAVLDDEALLEVYKYITNNPSAADLVEEDGDWPGLCGHTMWAAGEPIVGSWIDRDVLRKLCRRHKLPVEQATPELKKAAERSYEIQLTPLPAHEQLPPEERRRLLAQAVEDGNTVHRQRRRRTRRRVLGARGILLMDPERRPERPKHSQAPLCHASCPTQKATYLRHLREVWGRYEQVARQWRTGQTHLPFPPGTFPPGHSRPVPVQTSG